MGPPRLNRIILLAALVCAPVAHGSAADAADKEEPCWTYRYSNESDYGRELAAGRVGPPGLRFDAILKYADAVITGEGPSNYMARLDLQRDYYPDLDDAAAEAAIERAKDRDVACHKEFVETAYANITRLPADDTWRALQFLMRQNEDYRLIEIVAPLAFRLDPARFDLVASAASEGRPAKAAIFKAVRDGVPLSLPSLDDWLNEMKLFICLDRCGEENR
jgi:hypothetical protein